MGRVDTRKGHFMALRSRLPGRQTPLQRRQIRSGTPILPPHIPLCLIPTS